MSKLSIAITMGDAAGIGPEIIAKTLMNPTYYEHCQPLVIGDETIITRAMKLVGSAQKVREISHFPAPAVDPAYLDLVDLNLLPADLPYGIVSAAAGNAAFQYIAKAVQLAQAGFVQAICTAPLNKEALHKGGHNYPGHTEILANLMGVKNYAMLLSAPGLRVIHVTTHSGLIEAIAKINPERIYQVIELAQSFLIRLGIPEPRIAVCGINPHAGENGLFGAGEEEEKIIPAIQKAQSMGINASGPFAADSVFTRAMRGEFDLVVAMYHDQGHIPVKVLGFDTGVNITVGLQVIRTSVDHGTAFDIAGKGIADSRSLTEALKQAILLA